MYNMFEVESNSGILFMLAQLRESMLIISQPIETISELIKACIKELKRRKEGV